MSEFLVWEDDDGNAVALKVSGYSTDAYLKLSDKFHNGGYPEKYFTVKITVGSYYSSSSNGIRSSSGFENPHNPKSLSNGELYYSNGRLFRDRDSICLAFEHGEPIIFHGSKTINIPEDLIVPLPRIREKTFLVRKDDTFIYVSRDKYEYGLDRFFIGQQDNMKELKILDYVTYRDGGTTRIKTEAGEFYVPTPFHKGKPGYQITFNNSKFFECEELSVEEGVDYARVYGKA